MEPSTAGVDGDDGDGNDSVESGFRIRAPGFSDGFGFLEFGEATGGLKISLLEVYRRFLSLPGWTRSWMAGRPPRTCFWDSVFRLNLVTAIVAVHAAFSGFGCGHRRIYRDFAFTLQISFNFGDQLLMLLPRKPLLHIH